jgi:phosphoribosylformimino-5-aminoimidazole carboxamide ribotide isomerase
MVEGWTEQAMFGPIEVAQAFESTPLAAMILTDIDRHLEYPDASFALTTKFAEATKLPVIAAGVVRNLDDVSSLRYLPNIEGVVIGRALLDRSVDLGEALAIARPAPEPVARFK